MSVSDIRASSLADELPSRLHCLPAQVVVSDAGKPYESLGRLDQAIQPFGQGNRHDAVALAVQHQHRSHDLADTQVGAELVLH